MIEFENVSKTYPNGTHALHNISLKIEKGEFVFIVGPSGAGKSTFLKLIMHEETPSEGKIIINGNDVTRLRRRDIPYLRRHMGIVFQDFRLIDKMNVFDNVAFAMRAVGEGNATIKKRVPYVLNLVGLKDKMKNKPSELSGGEQQRVSLARALVNNPEIIVADEPTGNVDPELSHEILELLSEINSMGTTVLVVTHEHELVREFHQRVIAIDCGRIVSDSASDYSAVYSEDIEPELDPGPEYSGDEYQAEYAQEAEYEPEFAQEAEYEPEYAQETEYEPEFAQEAEYEPGYAQETEYEPENEQGTGYVPGHAQEADYEPEYAQETAYKPAYAAPDEDSDYKAYSGTAQPAAFGEEDEYIDLNSFSAEARLEADEYEINEYKGAHYADEDGDDAPRYPDNVLKIPD